MNSVRSREADEDCLFLEQVLDKLYDFGNKPASKKKLKSQKKKRKRCEEEEGRSSVQEVCSDAADIRIHDVGEHQQEQLKPELKRPSIQRVSQVEVVTFQDPRKKQKTRETPAPDKVPTPQVTEKKQSDQIEELNLEKARLEVHRFGITGFKKEQQRVFEQDRAIMLGARPPKKDYVNYKLLQQQVKEKKQKAKEDVQPELKKKKKSSERDKKQKKTSSGSGTAPTGQMGRFKNGMLILSSKEIQKIKGRK